MPLGSKPECVKCGTQETPLWHSTEAGNLCNACLEEERCSETNSNVRNEDEDKAGSLKPTRRSTRITRYCNLKSAIPHKVVPKGKGRRNLFKKTVRLSQSFQLLKIIIYVIPFIFSQLKHQQLRRLQLQVISYFTKALIFKWAI